MSLRDSCREMSSNTPTESAGSAAAPVRRRKYRLLKGVLLTLVSLVAIVLIAVQILLNSSFLTKTANRIASSYIDGDVSFGKIDASVFRSFPFVHLSIDDFSLTYPHDRFSEFDSIGVISPFRDEGRGTEKDTLASFRNLTVSMNYMAAIKGDIRIHSGEIGGARVFAHLFDDRNASWNVFGEQSKDTVSSPLPKIILRHIALRDNPHVVFTDIRDTLFALVDAERLVFDGMVDISDFSKHKIGLDMEKMTLLGRLPSDSASVSLKHLGINERKEGFDVDASADALIALAGKKALSFPLDLSGTVSFPDKDFRSISVKDLSAKAAMLSLSGEGDVKLYGDSTYVRAEALFDDCPVKEVMDYFGDFLPKEAKNLKTDARISLTALCDGMYIPESNTLPELIAQINIPKTNVSYKGFDYKGVIAADVNAMTDNYGKLDVSLDELEVDIAGIKFKGTGSAEDLLGDDPLYYVDLGASAALDTFNEFLPEGMYASGDIEAGVEGFILQSDIDPYNFAMADLEGFVRSDGIVFRDEPDSLYAFLDKTDLHLEKFGDGMLLSGSLGVKGTVDSLYATYGKTMFIRGRRLSLAAQNAKEIISEEFGQEMHPIVGNLNAESIAMTGEDSLYVGLRNTRNSFKWSSRKRGEAVSPLLTVSSRNSSLGFRQGVNRARLDEVGINLSAIKTSVERDARRERTLDSLGKMYPGIERDSLMKIAGIGPRRPARSLRKSNDDFGSYGDLNLQLSESLSEYMRDWDLSGHLQVDSGLVITPYFPLNNRLSAFDGSFTNNQVNIDSMTILSGESDVSAKGKVTGLRGALLRKEMLDLELALTSERLNANELLAAYDKGAKYVPEQRDAAMDERVSDGEYLSRVATDTLSNATSEEYSLIVIPSNLDATISLQGNEIDYSDLMVDWFASDINLRERCIQITNTVATSNMGDIYFEGFYSTRSKDDVKAGFDLNLVDITADKVITLIPAVDSIIPMLKSFKGMLDCEMAATTQLDTNMNFIPPSIDGVLKIAGSDLYLEADGAIRKLAKTLMFRDKRIGHIDDMSVQGLIGNSEIEVFPFILGVDRYQLAMSGIQNFDQSFQYHVSVLRSPLPFRIGINLWGDFDNWRYSIVRPKYRNTNVPVFTAQLDQMQGNLVESIHNIFSKGVERAVAQNNAERGTIDDMKTSIGYDGSLESGSLSEEQMSQLDSLQRADSLSTGVTLLSETGQGTASPSLDSLLNAKIDAMTSGAVSGNKEGISVKKQQRLARKDERKAFRESVKDLTCCQRFKAWIRRNKEIRSIR